MYAVQLCIKIGNNYGGKCKLYTACPVYSFRIATYYDVYLHLFTNTVTILMHCILEVYIILLPSNIKVMIMDCYHECSNIGYIVWCGHTTCTCTCTLVSKLATLCPLQTLHAFFTKYSLGLNRMDGGKVSSVKLVCMTIHLVNVALITSFWR